MSNATHQNTPPFGAKADATAGNNGKNLRIDLNRASETQGLLAPREVDALRDRKLERYRFSADRYLPDRIGYLLGNSETGGPARPDGLGFDELFVASLWESPVVRGSLPAFRLIPQAAPDLPESKAAGHYRQTLDLKRGLLETTVSRPDGTAYRSEWFASHADSNLLCARLQNTGEQAASWTLQLPVPAKARTRTIQESLVYAAGMEDSFTQWAWACQCDHPLQPQDDPGRWQFSLQAGESMEILLAVRTHWQGGDFADQVHTSVSSGDSFAELLARQTSAFAKSWRQTPVIDLPDERVEQLFYRSVYWLLSASGSAWALPQETPLASVKAWSGVPFTYGYGWGIYAFTLLGLEGRARRMTTLAWKPAGYRRNARVYLDRLKARDTEFFMKPSGSPKLDEGAPERGVNDYLAGNVEITDSGTSALSFPHQGSIYGDGRMRRCNQRHIDGFAAGFYHLLQRYHPDAAFERSVLYPALRGTAEFWRHLLEWNEEAGGFVTPPLHSVAENLTEISVLDAVLAALWNLRTAAATAKRLDLDSDLRVQWMQAADQLILPQNETIYTEFLGEDRMREGGGYFGMRAPMYLGFPLFELTEVLDSKKAIATLQAACRQNEQEGRLQGMISFVASGYAASAAVYGQGDLWLKFLARNFETLDPESGALRETDSVHPYFHTSYGAYICAVLSALQHSSEGSATLFPSLPKEWERAAYYHLPAENGKRISARIADGRIECSVNPDLTPDHD